jgi:hypothetical protein
VEIPDQSGPLPFAHLDNRYHAILVRAPDRGSHQSDISELTNKGFTAIALCDNPGTETTWLPANFVCYTSKGEPDIGRRRIQST